jgi:hypothetical protein
MASNVFCVHNSALTLFARPGWVCLLITPKEIPHEVKH